MCGRRKAPTPPYCNTRSRGSRKRLHLRGKNSFHQGTVVSSRQQRLLASAIHLAGSTIPKRRSSYIYRRKERCQNSMGKDTSGGGNGGRGGKTSAAEVHGAEARAHGKIVAGDKASKAQGVAANTVRHIVAKESAARANISKGGTAACAQKRAAHCPRFAPDWQPK